MLKISNLEKKIGVFFLLFPVLYVQNWVADELL